MSLTTTNEVRKALLKMGLPTTKSNHGIDAAEYGLVADDSGPEAIASNNAAFTEAIEAASTLGSPIKVPDGTYYFDETIRIPRNIGLKLSHGTALRCNANINMIRIEDEGAFISGGTLLSTVDNYANAMVLFTNNSGEIGFDRKRKKTGLFNIKLQRSFGGTRSGIGIHILAAADNDDGSYPEYITFEDVNLADLDTAIRIECIENGTELSFANSNYFNNITMDDCITYIHMILSGDATPAIAGNTFSNIHIQADGQSLRAIKLESDTVPNAERLGRNMFTNVMVWDWYASASANGGDGYSIEFGEGVTKNSFVNIEGVVESEILGDTVGNRFIGTDFPKVQLRDFGSPADLPDPALNTGVMYYTETFPFLGIIYSNGTVWAPLGQSSREFITEFNTNHTFLQGEIVPGIFYKNDTEYTADQFNFATTDIDTLTNEINVINTFAENDILKLTSSGTLPAPLATNTDYYTVNVTGTSFQVALTPGGAAIDITDVGSGTHTIDPGQIWDISNGQLGQEIHIMNYSATKTLIIRCSPTRLFRDNFAGVNSEAGKGIVLNQRYNEVILRCVESGDWFIVHKRYDIPFEG